MIIGAPILGRNTKGKTKANAQCVQCAESLATRQIGVANLGPQRAPTQDMQQGLGFRV